MCARIPERTPPSAPACGPSCATRKAAAAQPAGAIGAKGHTDRVVVARGYRSDGDESESGDEDAPRKRARRAEGGYEGATVNDPVRGFHERVAVLDWKALYPSVMMAHNLCHSTWVRDASLRGTSEGAVAHPISDATTYHFVTSATHKGILPRILEELLEQRASARKQGKVHAARAKADGVGADEAARQTLLAKVFDGRQLALKVPAVIK